MPEEVAINKFLLDVLPIATTAVSEDEVINAFTRTVSASFGIDRVILVDIKKKESSPLAGYISNTKKPYIDNQLSEYSAFPDLIDYKNRGYKSCAVMPLLADGKVVSLLELLSNNENKFDEGTVRSVVFGASLIGFVLMYKGELSRSVRLATYFDAAFNNPYVQLIVSEDGSIVKYNKTAVKQLGLDTPERRKINDIISLDFAKLLGMANGATVNIVSSSNANKIYALAVSKINDKLVHIAANDITDAFAYSSINEMMNKERDLCIVFLDSKMNISNISQSSEKMLGYAKNLLVDRDMKDIVTREYHDQFTDNLNNIKKNSDIASGIVELELESGRKHLHYTAKRFLSGYMLMLVNAEAEMFISNVRKDLGDFVDSSSDVVFGVDALGYIKDCNLPAELVLGFAKEELISKELKLLYSEQNILDRDISYVRNEGKGVDNSFVNLIAKDSRIIPATHSIRLLTAAGADKEIEYLVVIKELGTKRRLEAQENALRDLTTQVKRLKSEGDLKSQFINNISHELKTPLTSIKGFTKLVYDGESGQLNDDQKEKLKITLDETDRLMLVIQQILDAAKLDADKVKLEMKEVDLENMANNPSIKALEESAKNKGLGFTWKVEWNVPRPITADPNRLIQVFVNLIGNSIKFTEKGSITVHIVMKNKKNVQCNIIDTGIGIADDDKKKLFKMKFYEAAKKGLVQQPGAGTGLGLSITRDIIRLHRGKISFESTQGKGSTFWFTLPVSQKPSKKKKPQIAAN